MPLLYVASRMLSGPPLKATLARYLTIILTRWIVNASPAHCYGGSNEKASLDGSLFPWKYPFSINYDAYQRPDSHLAILLHPLQQLLTIRHLRDSNPKRVA